MVAPGRNTPPGAVALAHTRSDLTRYVALGAWTTCRCGNEGGRGFND